MAPTIVLITGGNSGVGFATAKVLASASKDFHVILTSRSVENAEAAKADIESTKPKGQITTVQLDILDEQSIGKAVATIDAKFGRIDVLINNAGTAGPNIADLRQRIELCFQTNVVGSALIAAAFRPLLFKSERPYSIYVSSGVGSLALAADPTSPVYGILAKAEAYRSSKAAVNMLMLQEAATYANTPLKCFAFCPGMVRSNLRGRSEEARSGHGKAGDPEDSGRGILGIIEGKRDADVNKLINKDVVVPF